MHRETGRYAAAAMIVCSAFAIARPAQADVYKCRGADGAIAFQDHACASSQIESRVEIAPAPPPAASPDYGRTPRRESREASGRTHASTPARREALSYECRAANGEVFYRHGTCPGKISAKGASRKQAGESYAVTAAPLSRSEACRRMASAGSIGRAGRERDETTSTYDRNLGRDPCRYF